MATIPPSHHMQPAGPDTMPAQLEDIRVRLQRGADRMDRLERGYRELKGGQATISGQLFENTRLTKENTEITTQVRDLMTTGRMGTKLIKWAGGMAIAGAAIWSAVYAALHNGKLPP